MHTNKAQIRYIIYFADKHEWYFSELEEANKAIPKLTEFKPLVLLRVIEIFNDRNQIISIYTERLDNKLYTSHQI